MWHQQKIDCRQLAGAKKNPINQQAEDAKAHAWSSCKREEEWKVESQERVLAYGFCLVTSVWINRQIVGVCTIISVTKFPAKKSHSKYEAMFGGLESTRQWRKQSE